MNCLQWSCIFFNPSSQLQPSTYRHTLCWLSFIINQLLSPISFVSIYSTVSLSLSSFFVVIIFEVFSLVRFSLVSIVSLSHSFSISHRFLVGVVVVCIDYFNNMILLFCFCFIDITSRIRSTNRSLGSAIQSVRGLTIL